MVFELASMSYWWVKDNLEVCSTDFPHYLQWLFSAVLLGLTGTRLHYTLFLPPYDPLNNGQAFYDPIAVELLATSVLALFWSSFMCVFVLSCPGLCPVQVRMLTLCAESTSSTAAMTMAASRPLRASSSASLCSSSCS